MKYHIRSVPGPAITSATGTTPALQCQNECLTLHRENDRTLPVLTHGSRANKQGNFSAFVHSPLVGSILDECKVFHILANLSVPPLPNLWYLCCSTHRFILQYCCSVCVLIGTGTQRHSALLDCVRAHMAKWVLPCGSRTEALVTDSSRRSHKNFNERR